MRNDDVKPDWWIVALDETRHYNIAEEDKPKIERILGVYFYDKNEYTYCCELTPSHFLIYHSTSVHVRSDVEDDERDRLDGAYGHEPGEDCYMHVRDVEAIASEWKKQYGAAEGGEDEVREYLNGTGVF